MADVCEASNVGLQTVPGLNQTSLLVSVLFVLFCSEIGGGSRRASKLVLGLTLRKFWDE